MLTFRYFSWQLDLITVLSLVWLAVSVWLMVLTRRHEAAAKRRLLTNVERDLLHIPVGGIFFRLAAVVADLLFALTLLVVVPRSVYPLLALYIVGRGAVPLHSFLLLRRQRKAIARVPEQPASVEGTCE